FLLKPCTHRPNHLNPLPASSEAQIEICCHSFSSSFLQPIAWLLSTEAEYHHHHRMAAELDDCQI
ncbi:hypothetical protein PENTCL1PPCAC_20045, partial [Pristionchus entomophagus]